MSRIAVIEDYLDYLIPNPKCELDYNKDYEFLIAVMLSAQTTDKRVNKVTKVLFSKYPTLKDLKEASLNDIKNIIKELGNYTKKASAVIEIARTLIDCYGGVVPKNRKALESLPCVGRKTCNVFLSEIFNIPNFAVDTHVLRVSKRLKIAKGDVLEVERTLKRKIKKENWIKRHHQLVLFGRYHCKAITPNCNLCGLKKICYEYKEKNLID